MYTRQYTTLIYGEVVVPWSSAHKERRSHLSSTIANAVSPPHPTSLVCGSFFRAEAIKAYSFGLLLDSSANTETLGTTVDRRRAAFQNCIVYISVWV